MGTKLTTIAVQKKVVAFGNCLGARLGYDRSGYAEAVVRGHGMPLFAKEENARRGTGEVEQREQEKGYGQQKAAPAKTVVVDASKLARGDLIVKVPLKLLSRQRGGIGAHRLRLAPGVRVLMPPVALVTTGRGGQPPMKPLASLLSFVLLPAIVTKLALAVAAETPRDNGDEDGAEAGRAERFG